MRSHRQRAAVASCLIAILCWGETVPIRASNCRSHESYESIVHGGYVGGDGKVHYEVSYESNVTGDQIDIFHQAMNYWNARSDETGIWLDDVSGNYAGDFRFKKRPPGTGYCADYIRESSDIFYDELQMSWAPNNPDIAARLYAHELGHALGLDHKGYGSIMYDGNALQTCEQKGYDMGDVTSDDASDVRDCAFAAHEGHDYGPPPSYFWEDWQPSCWWLWYTVEYWRCNSEFCWFDYAEDIPWDYYCW